MSVEQLRYNQVIPASLHTVWEFFTEPANLVKITPSSLDLRISNKLYGSGIYPGQVITYQIKPFGGLSFFWLTEITHVEPLRYFVDEQRQGPYSFWHHQHHFREVTDGVEMTDLIYYKIPMGWLGKLANKIMIRKELQKIFIFRHRQIEILFDQSKTTQIPRGKILNGEKS